MTPLRQRMLEELQRRNYSSQTVRGYIFAVREFAEYYRKSPELLGAEELRRYQVHLLQERKLAPGTVVRMQAVIEVAHGNRRIRGDAEHCLHTGRSHQDVIDMIHIPKTDFSVFSGKAEALFAFAKGLFCHFTRCNIQSNTRHAERIAAWVEFRVALRLNPADGSIWPLRSVLNVVSIFPTAFQTGANRRTGAFALRNLQLQLGLPMWRLWCPASHSLRTTISHITASFF